MPNHQNAEMFLRETFKLAGGKSVLKFKRGLAFNETHHTARTPFPLTEQPQQKSE